MGDRETTRWRGAWRWVLPVAFFATLIGLWQLAAGTGALADLLGLERYFVPSPAEIASAIWENRVLLGENAWVTVREMVLGFVWALLAGVGFAVAMHFSTVVRLSIYPLLIASQTIPVIVIAPVLLLWFGFGIAPKAIVIVLVCFFPITVSTLQGLRSVEPDAIKLMRSLYASRWQIFRRLEWKAAMPYLFTGVRIAIVFVPIGAVFGEWVGGSSGLGHEILTDNAQLEIARLFGAVALLSATSLVLFGLTALAERRVVTWR